MMMQLSMTFDAGRPTPTPEGQAFWPGDPLAVERPTEKQLATDSGGWVALIQRAQAAEAGKRNVVLSATLHEARRRGARLERGDDGRLRIAPRMVLAPAYQKDVDRWLAEIATQDGMVISLAAHGLCQRCAGLLQSGETGHCAGYADEEAT